MAQSAVAEVASHANGLPMSKHCSPVSRGPVMTTSMSANETESTKEVQDTSAARKDTSPSQSDPTRITAPTSHLSPASSPFVSPSSASSSKHHHQDTSRGGKRRSQHSPIRLTPASSSSFSIPTIARQHVHASTFSSSPATRSDDLASGKDQARDIDQGARSDAVDTLRKEARQASIYAGEAANQESRPRSIVANKARTQSTAIDPSGSESSSWSTSTDSDAKRDTQSNETSVHSIDPDLDLSRKSQGAAFLPADAKTTVSPADVCDEKVRDRASNAVYSVDSLKGNTYGDDSTAPHSAAAAHEAPPRKTTVAPSTLVQDTVLDHHRCQQQKRQEGTISQTPSPPSVTQRDELASRVYDACQNAGNSDWVALLELAPFASQHHLSSYNCLKFGHDGSPFVYIPLTLQQPVQTAELMARQEVSEAKALEWLAQKRGRHLALSASPKKQRLMSPSDDTDEGSERTHNYVGLPYSPQPTTDVRMREISPAPPTHTDPTDATIDAQGSRRAMTTTVGDATVPVTAGPLKNEAVMMQEWETPLCPQESQKTDCGARVGETAPGQGQPTAHSVKTSDTHPISISPIIPPEILADVSRLVEAGIPEAILAADDQRRYCRGHPGAADARTIAAEHEELQKQGRQLIRCRLTRLDLCEIAAKAERELQVAAQAKRRPRLLRIDQDPVEHGNVRTYYRDESGQDTDAVDAQRVYAALNGHAGPQNEVPRDSALASETRDHRGFVMGNLLLSSCPGKKVRLTGPVRGRGAICRSLDLDLKRVKELGVGAIVCCLDDDELQFLGAPWSEYEEEVDKLGIEVIRLPMAEGFCPTDVIATDAAIACVVDDYTLRGIHVLVHCRGGVGRAGLIACMWMLKLGLVRSDADERLFRDISMSAGRRNFDLAVQQSTARTEDDVRQTAMRLIETIRRRRSPKAIETAEQVMFLKNYIKYLYSQENKSYQYASQGARYSSAAPQRHY